MIRTRVHNNEIQSTITFARLGRRHKNVCRARIRALVQTLGLTLEFHRAAIPAISYLSFVDGAMIPSTLFCMVILAQFEMVDPATSCSRRSASPSVGWSKCPVRLIGDNVELKDASSKALAVSDAMMGVLKKKAWRRLPGGYAYFNIQAVN